ncbi:MAG: type I-E CRISPR-associated protein Cas7/Cse4/CasC [Planctomycetota bacterium]
MPTRFIQFHTLTPYATSLLNRDDAGFAKRIPFGGVPRTRISSQCLKRHWRTFDGEHALDKLDAPATVRSRLTFEEHVAKPLIAAGIPAETAREVTVQIVKEILGFNAERAKAKAGKKGDDAEPQDPAVKTDQITVLGKPELDYILAEARAICEEVGSEQDAKKLAKSVKDHFGREGKANMQALAKGAGLSAALFGRMVTSDNLARCDAAIHVAHAFTVHAEASESEFFSAVDDLVSASGELGSGHIGTTEVNTGLYYGYVVVDVPKLIENLSGDTELAAAVVGELAWLMATVSPGAKLGSTAPYAYAELVFAEAGDAQPRSLANAFMAQVTAGKQGMGAEAAAKLAGHCKRYDTMYGNAGNRALSALDAPADLCCTLGIDGAVPLADLARWASEAVRQAEGV